MNYIFGLKDMMYVSAIYTMTKDGIYTTPFRVIWDRTMIFLGTGHFELNLEIVLFKNGFFLYTIFG